MTEPTPLYRWQSAEVRTDEACRAADLASILADLQLVARWCALHESAEFDDDVHAALWEAAVVAYGRSFTAGRDSKGRSGRRRRIDDTDLAVLTDVQRATHVAVRAERNRHIAHRDDRLGEINQVIRMSGEGDAAGVRAVGLTTWRRRGPTAYDVAALQALAERLIEHLEPILVAELDALNVTR
ncbi:MULTISPECIES: hypothetical protein [unclassified Aeromicrobium]|uniref:hypothetical protein n=1 Tax=unclassified Aeromicrobium TaxID=2633570 RepID=UPI00288C02F6|nr:MULTISPECIES: hypothetical protein [unclassified Aeromicrobium]